MSEKRSWTKVSKELKEALITLVVEDGYTIKLAAKILSIKYSNAKKIIEDNKKNKDKNNEKRKRGPKKKIDSTILQNIEVICSENSAYTIKNVKDILFEKTGVNLSMGSIATCLAQLKIKLKNAKKI